MNKKKTEKREREKTWPGLVALWLGEEREELEVENKVDTFCHTHWKKGEVQRLKEKKSNFYSFLLYFYERLFQFDKTDFVYLSESLLCFPGQSFLRALGRFITWCMEQNMLFMDNTEGVLLVLQGYYYYCFVFL